MFFRSAKQSLGIQHCASPDMAMQVAHIDVCILAFTFLQYQRIKYKYHSVEQALRAFRDAYFHDIHASLSSTDHLNHAFA
ncbi:hypothetical protein JST99_04370 [Candidatus Dependentiae bacterium]|nr:hypothetical protein [Candidatus Dependentiae bacterium]